MTDDRDSRRKWLAAAGIAPIAAAAFGIATSFAIDHDPTPTAAAEPPPASEVASVLPAASIETLATAGPDAPPAAAQNASVADAKAEVRVLLKKLRKQRERLKDLNSAPASVMPSVSSSGGSSSGGSSSGGSSSGGSSSGGSSYSPPVHTTSGAS